MRWNRPTRSKSEGLQGCQKTSSTKSNWRNVLYLKLAPNTAQYVDVTERGGWKPVSRLAAGTSGGMAPPGQPSGGRMRVFARAQLIKRCRAARARGRVSPAPAGRS